MNHPVHLRKKIIELPKKKLIELQNVINNSKRKRYFKASVADYGTKVKIIKQNKDKYPMSAMCKVLNISRSYYYNYKENLEEKDPMTDEAPVIFRDNKKTYGTRRIKTKLEEKGFTVSKRRIGALWLKKGSYLFIRKLSIKFIRLK